MLKVSATKPADWVYNMLEHRSCKALIAPMALD